MTTNVKIDNLDGQLDRPFWLEKGENNWQQVINPISGETETRPREYEAFPLASEYSSAVSRNVG